MESPLQKLALDHWYQVLMAIGAAVFLLAGGGLLKEFPTGATAAMAAGAFFIGMGEWINHPSQTIIVPATARFPAGIVVGHPRHTSAAGIAFDAIGIALFALGVYMLLR